MHCPHSGDCTPRLVEALVRPPDMKTERRGKLLEYAIRRV